MNTKGRIHSLTVLTLGTVITLLAGCGAPGVHAAGPRPDRDPVPASSLQVHGHGDLNDKLEQFELYLAGMQRELGIPGMSAAIIKDQQLIWAQGFGYADVRAARPAAPDTPYELASVTKPLSAVLLLQLADQGRVSVEDPASDYGVYLKSPGVIRVKHLLGHTSQGEPGSVFGYSGARYGRLQKVIERASGQPFPALMTQNILNPLTMRDSAPIDRLDRPEYAHIRERLSRPYGMDGTYVSEFSPAAGMVSTVLDLAQFDIALDQGQLIRPETRVLAFTAQTLESGDPPVYGLGWFVQDYLGTRLVFHSGYDAFSHLYLKFIDQGYTLILLTNSSTFGEHQSARDWNVMRYPAALAFYKLFVRDTGLGDTVEWDASEEVIAAQLQAAEAAGTLEIARQEIQNRYLTSWILGRKVPAQKALETYLRFFATGSPPDFTARRPLAMIERVGNEAYSIVEFSLQQDARVDIYAVGEYWLGGMADYGGIEDVASRKLIWEMTPDRTSPAGGCVTNRQATDQIDLRAGTYRLHYRTDWGHAYANWDGLPPDSLFWGIALYAAGADVEAAARTIAAAPSEQLLAGSSPLLSTPPVSRLEYAVLWPCLGVLLSVLVSVPLWIWRTRRQAGTSRTARRWALTAAWAAWVNSLLCLIQIAVTVRMAGSLESVVESPVMLISNSPGIVWAFVGVTYGCIALAIAQVVFAVLAWKGKQWSLVGRLYYSLATLAAAGYLALLGIWGLIAAPY